MTVVLFQPQIPQNTGNIVRTCSVTGFRLALVKPLGFSVSNRRLKRAGLDYWEEVDISFLDDLAEHLDKLSTPFYFFSSHSKRPYSEIAYTPEDHLIFGSESSGLPPIFEEKYPHLFYTLPMKTGARCLNLANTVAVVLYEALRQKNYVFL